MEVSMATEPNGQPTEAQAQAQPEPQQQVQREDVYRLSWEQSTWPDRPPSPEALAATIRALSLARRISYLNHGGFRFEERFADAGFDVFDMYRVLEHGMIEGAIEAGARKGEWKVKMVGVPDGTDRKMGVVPIVVQEKRLLIKTVEWEDR
jgi:hypothetical protein